MFGFRKKKKDKYADCPVELLDLLEASQSKWRKAVVKQFIDQHEWRTKVEGKLERIKWQLAAIIGFLVAIFFLLLRSTL